VTDARNARHAKDRSVLRTGVVLGVGVVGALDEAIFHQVLQWHTLYWSSSESVRLLSDGIFHLITLALLIVGGVRLWQTSATLRGRRDALVAAMLMGAGGFNLYDGLVQHVLLHLHLVNEHVCGDPSMNNSLSSCSADIPYEIAWLLIAAILLLVGLARWRAASARTTPARRVAAE
jgi:uncharacterized membrane protein